MYINKLTINNQDYFNVPLNKKALEEIGCSEDEIKQLFLSENKKTALEKIKSTHASGNTESEDRDTWPSQREAALAHTAHTADAQQTELLNDLRLDNETLDTLAQSILKKSKAMNKLIGLVGGLKRKAEKALQAATSVEDIEQVMMGLKTEMNQKIAAFNAAQT